MTALALTVACSFAFAAEGGFVSASPPDPPPPPREAPAAETHVSIGEVRLAVEGARVEARLAVPSHAATSALPERSLAPDEAPREAAARDGTGAGAAEAVPRSPARGGVLSHTVTAAGETIVRALETTGLIVTRTLDSAGTLVAEGVVGGVLELPVVSERANETGQPVKTVKDLTGALIEVVQDAEGNVLSARVVSAAGGPARGM